MTRWFSKEPEKPVEVVERLIPVEIPILTETKRRLARQEYEEALRSAYGQVVGDLQRAFGTPFPTGWTNREILERGRVEGWEHLPDFLQRLTDLYTPMRFGGRPESSDPELLLGLLQSIYAARPMWRLYVQDRPGAGTSSRLPAGPRAPSTGDHGGAGP
ncbi:MAG TPA: DUF4129 domain-containing protein [Thermoplasmata archaeon]|nr:DUF4129 domain-containing protein [Thermoplasmata archaeon]